MGKKSKSLKNFNNLPYSRRVEKPWGWEIHWVPDGKPYMGKLLHINAGQRFSLQYHDQKLESWYLLSGRAKIIWDNNQGELEEVEMELGKGYSIDARQRHRILGIADCEIVEVSMPEEGTTYRLEDDYQRAGRNEDVKERELRNEGE